MNIRYLSLALLSIFMIGCEDMNELPITPNGTVALSNYVVEVDGALIDVVVMSDKDVSVANKPEWIIEQETSVSGNNHIFTFQVNANVSLDERKGEVKFNTDGKECLVNISQKAYPAYVPSTSLAGLEEIVEKTELESQGNATFNGITYQIKGRCNNQRPTAPFYRTWDGESVSSVFYSQYASVGSVPVDYWPIVLDLYLPESGNIFEHVEYTQNHTVLGAWKNVELWVSKTISTEEEVTNRTMDNFEKIGEMDCGGAAEWLARRKVLIPASKSVTGVRTVRLVVNDASDNGSTVCIGALELEAFSRKPLNFDTSDLFTDNSCSALKEGITSVDIADYEYPLFQNVAHYLNLGLYPQERILNITKTMTMIPTSISTTVGTPLIVMAEGKESDRVQVKIISSTDQAVLNNYTLQEGANKLSDCKIGHVEISYTGNTPVKLNFLNGEVKE